MNPYSGLFHRYYYLMEAWIPTYHLCKSIDTEVVSGRLSEEDISEVDLYLLNYKVSYNSLMRCAVFYFIDNNISLKNKEDTCLLAKKLPSVEEIVDVLSKIADKNPTQKSKSAKRVGAWREWFENTENIELLASVFWNE
jgi:hypothetical protein